MTWMDVRGFQLGEKGKIYREGSWGHFHELGHNFQSSLWTFDGSVEVTCNLFTLYAMEKVVGITPWDHPSLKNSFQIARTHIANGAPFSKWKKQPFLALIMYVQLQKAFGWDAYKKVFREYEKLPAKEHPKTEQQKRDQWMIRFSKIVRRNLGPFFKWWGIPISRKAYSAVAHLPKWLPKDPFHLKKG